MRKGITVLMCCLILFVGCSDSNVKGNSTKEKEVSNYNGKVESEYKDGLVELPSSNILQNTNGARQGTRGVAHIDGNYYVGYFCGLDKVWKACDSATTEIAKMKKHQNEKSSQYYTGPFNELKRLTPYIKAIQDTNVENSDPEKLKRILDEYMIDTVIMNYKNMPSDLEVKMQDIIGQQYLVDNFGSWKISDIFKKVSNMDDKRYPSLNDNILE